MSNETSSAVVTSSNRLAEGRLLEGLGELSPDWMRLNLMADVLLTRLTSAADPVALDELWPALGAALADRRLDVSSAELAALLDRLATLGLVASSSGQLRLLMSPYLAAIKFEAVGFIQEDLRAALKASTRAPAGPGPTASAGAGAAPVHELLRRYGDATDVWRLDPVEARWGVLKAVSTLDPGERASLAGALRAESVVGVGPTTTLHDTVSLMLGNPIPEDWLARQAPRLVGRDVKVITPEGLFNAAGGLGRVTQYHTAAMARLVGSLARVWVYEPMYTHRPVFGSPSELELIDYEDLTRQLGATPLERIRSFSINVRGREVAIEVHRSRLPDGRVACLLKDPTDYFARALYTYGRFGQASWAEFSEWLSEGTVAAIAAEMRERRVVDGNAYHPPLLWANDAQAALVPEVKLRLDQSGDSILWEAREYFTTHTILNRSGENLESMGIPAGHRWAGDRMSWLDASSFGIRIADGRNAVSSCQAAEIQEIDPRFDIVAISNGTSIRDFEDALRAVHASDVQNPTVAEIARAKRSAKLALGVALGLGPDGCQEMASRFVVSYSGRMVTEKVSRGPNGALVDENLRALVRQGVAVIIYGNVQPTNPDSFRLYDDLLRLSNQLRQEGHPGRVCVRTGWNQRDQIELLKATDLQVQVSDSIRSPNFPFRGGKTVGTEAAGYTEAPVGRFAGLQMGPVEIHGLLNRIGLPVDWSRPGSGSLLLAREPTSSAYLEEMLAAARCFQTQPDVYYSMGQKAYALGEVYDALLTAAEYLRQFSQTWDAPKIDGT